MAWEIRKSVHILTLVIRRDRDIPLVRGKTKLLAREMGFDRLAVVRLATAASEAARLLLGMFGGGKVNLSGVHFASPPDRCGLELVFLGQRPCKMIDDAAGPVACPIDLRDLEVAPIKGLKKVLDLVQVEGGGNSSIRLRCLQSKTPCDWQKLRSGILHMKNRIFRDTEESYVENLRAKHEEIRRLLKEKSEQNLELDRINTELLQLNQELEALANERTLRDLALKIADQVRNPASVIGGLVRLLRKKLGNISEREAAKLNAIEHQAAKLEQIVADFEHLARQQSLFFVKEDLVEIVREAVNSCTALGHRGVRVRLLMPEHPVFIKANRSILKIALLHVLRNSALVSPPGAEVEVRVDPAPDRPVVSVADRGPGMPPEMRKNLLHGPVSSKTKSTPTTGLGLLIVKQIMDEHRAVITVEDRKGGGTVVRLEFPLRLG